MSGADAARKISAGADVVHIYTSLIYKGPELVRETAVSIEKGRQQCKNARKPLL